MNMATALPAADFPELSSGDRAALMTLPQTRVRKILPDGEIIAQGAEPRGALFVKSGWACRYKSLPDGSRQIVALLLPGDFCELNLFLPGPMDYGITAVTALTCVEFARPALMGAMQHNPLIGQAILRRIVTAAAIQQEWTVNIGQRVAIARVAHLMSEIATRRGKIHGSRSATCEMPLTQSDLADATGLAPVHVNRTLKALRARDLIALQRRTMIIRDPAALAQVSAFSPGYLHLR